MVLTAGFVLLSPWIVICDIREHRIPNKALLALWALISLNAIHGGWRIEMASQERLLFLLLIGTGFFYLSRRSIGFGDIKLIALSGAPLGQLSDLVAVLFIATLIALAWAGIFRTKRVPFGPGIVIGMVLILLGG